MKKINFSVCFIGKNEASVLPRALESLKEFRDRGGEICYLDTGSTDDSAKIARDFGCKVEEVGSKFLIEITEEEAKAINETFVVDDEEPVVKTGDKMFDFASARNYCADNLASNDMILQLDCDEMYTSFDIDRVIEEVDKGADQFEYQFVFSHDAHGNPLLEFIQSKAYRKSKLKWVRIIHEVLEPIVAENLKRVYLDPSILKNEHWQNHETNRSGYLKGLAYDCFRDPRGDRQSHYFARELMWHDRPKSAIKEFKRHLEISWWKPERSQSMVYIGRCLLNIGGKENEKEAVEWYHRAFQEEAGRREPLISLAEYYFKNKDWQRVLCYCAAALKIDMNGYYANNKYHYTHVPHELMAEAYWCLSKKNDGKKEILKALSYSPDLGKLLHDLRFHFDLPKISILIPTLGRKEGLNRCLESIKGLNYPQGKIEVLVKEDSPRKGVPIRVNELFNESSGDFVVYAANDMEFHPDSVIIALFEIGFFDKIKEDVNSTLLAFNSGDILPDEGNICEHFMISREAVSNLLGGKIFCEEFNHVGVDNLLWNQIKKRGIVKRSNLAKINHYHFSKGESEMDDVYKMAWNDDNVKKDRELLEKKLKEL